ncbi:MAG: nucleotidyltransferase family protein [Kineosporiaceae bacterium]
MTGTGAPSLRQLAAALDLGGGPRDAAPVLGADPASVAPFARGHGVLGLLPASGDLGEEVGRFRAETRARLVRALADVSTARAAAAGAGARLAVVKGPVLALAVYPRPDTRPFGDIDLLTDPASFPRLLEALEALGGVVETRNWDAMIRARFSEVSVRMPAGTVADVHWSLVNVHRLRRIHRVDDGGVLASAAASGGGLPAPDPLAHLGYVCWHLTASGGTRLLWACDVELAARALPGRGAELRTWARRTGTVLPVAVALDFAARMFPGGAAAGLAGGMPASPWRWVNAAAKAAVVSRPGVRLSGAFVPYATRRTSWGSLAAVRPPVASLLTGRAPAVADLDTLGREGGGAQRRRDYLAAVAGGRLT